MRASTAVGVIVQPEIKCYEDQRRCGVFIFIFLQEGEGERQGFSSVCVVNQARSCQLFFQE